MARPSKESRLRIANLALSKVGAATISSFTLSGSNEARAVDDVYDDVLEEVLSEHPWSFAQRRVALTTVVADDVSRTIQGRIFPPITITAATKDEPCVVTAADHGLANGDRIKIVGVAGMTQLNSNFYIVMSVTTNTFALASEDDESEVDSSAYTTYTSGGQIYLANSGDPLLITAATATNPVVLTAASHGLSDGDWVYIHGVLGMTQLNGNFYIVDGATTNTLNLQDTDAVDADGSAYTTYISGGQILVAPDIPQTDTGAVVVYFKPTDLIKPIQKSDVTAWIKVEEDKILSNVESLKIIYTFKNEDVSMYFPKFVQCLAGRLAAEICFRITNSVSKSTELLKFYQDALLPMAVSVDSTQNTPDEAQADEWLDAAIMGGRPIVTGSTWHFI